MRTVFNAQMNLGEIAIENIRIDFSSRDDIPKILLGLQHIYTDQETRDRVFAILGEVMPMRAGGIGTVSSVLGRPGMPQWRSLVLAMMRMGLNADYDRIQELANQHSTLRQMLGHSSWEDATRYSLQTIKDNVALFTPEVLDRINQAVVGSGHQLLGVGAGSELEVRVDSFVGETDVHFPTDMNLLLDAIRVTVRTCGEASARYGWTDWNKHTYNFRQFRHAYLRLQRMKYSSSKDPVKQQAKADEIRRAYKDYLDLAQSYLKRAQVTCDRIKAMNYLDFSWTTLQKFIVHGERQIDQIRRRVIEGETIPHDEKVFSLFQLHTEWVSKGKAGVPVELGVRIAIVEDQHRFILHHMVMEKTTDDKVAVPLIDETKKRFGSIKSASFDKGFHSPSNQAELKERVSLVVMPKKGKLSKADVARESAPEFKRLRRQHSAVESAINGLETDGLDRCPDDGIVGFKRYVAMAVVTRNIQRIGAILQQRQQAARQKRRAPPKAA